MLKFHRAETRLLAVYITAMTLEVQKAFFVVFFLLFVARNIEYTHIDIAKVWHFITNPSLSLIKSIVKRFYSPSPEDGGSGFTGKGQYVVVFLFEWNCYHLAEIVCSGLMTE